MITIDFETFSIEPRPEYPPKPVGVSIKYDNQPSRYYAWGHVAGGNNCTFGDVCTILNKAWDSVRRVFIQNDFGLLFHNAKFDLDVAETHCGLPRLPWDRYHDTMFLLFLEAPNSCSLGLKPSAERLLGLPPDERDAVNEWLREHQPVPGVKIGKSPRGEHPPGAYIAYAPGDLVAPYARGDTDRTKALFDLLYPKIKALEMDEAYDRERRLMPILLDNERRGLRVDTARLAYDEERYTRALDKADTWVRARLGAGIDVSSGPQLANALLAAGVTTVSRLGTTPKGFVATNKEALDNAISDDRLKRMLRYRGFLATSLQTFVRPWIESAARTGTIHTSWNQVHGAEGGTRTGRPSTSKPNFLNIPKETTELFNAEGCPRSPVYLPPLPNVRSYVLPREVGHTILDRDYSQQEPRLLALFSGGDMLQQYLDEPWTDFHDMAKARVDSFTGKDYKRKKIKTINLGLIYGMGVGTMAKKNGATVEETADLKAAVLALYPGLKKFQGGMRQRAKRGEPIRTWGGRLYWCEDPTTKDGVRKTYAYKMVNTLIQGSAADITKEAMIRYVSAAPKGHELCLQVYDQLVASVPEEDLHHGLAVLRSVMDSVETDIPLLTEGDWSSTNWADLKPYDRKGVRV